MTEAKIDIKDDDTLHKLLQIEMLIPDTITISDRIFCELPNETYLGKIPSDLGDGRKSFDTVFKDFTPHLDSSYILLGESVVSSNPDGSPDGGRDLVNNPVTKKELFAYVELFGVEALHLDFPRETEVN